LWDEGPTEHVSTLGGNTPYVEAVINNVHVRALINKGSDIVYIAESENQVAQICAQTIRFANREVIAIKSLGVNTCGTFERRDAITDHNVAEAQCLPSNCAKTNSSKNSVESIPPTEDILFETSPVIIGSDAENRTEISHRLYIPPNNDTQKRLLLLNRKIHSSLKNNCLAKSNGRNVVTVQMATKGKDKETLRYRTVRWQTGNNPVSGASLIKTRIRRCQSTGLQSNAGRANHVTRPRDIVFDRGRHVRFG
jgi:hypothetical protein